jgi:hypothetical protein
MISLYFEKGRIELRTRQNAREPWSKTTTIDSGFVLHPRLEIMNHAMFPLMNNTVVLPSVDVIAIPNKQKKVVTEQISAKGEIDKNGRANILKVSNRAFYYDGLVVPEFDDAHSAITFECSDLTQNGQAEISWNDKISLVFNAKEDYSAAKINLMQHIATREKTAGVSGQTPTYPPACQCGHLKAWNPDYSSFSKTGAPPAWSNKYTCFKCLRGFCEIDNLTRKLPEGTTQMPPKQMFEILKLQMNLAEQNLGDKLAMAHVLNLLGFFMMNFTRESAKTIAVLEEAYGIVKDHEAFKPYIFHETIFHEYLSVIFYLGQVCRTAGQYDKALTYLQEGLIHDKAEGDILNISKSLNAIGSVLVKLNRLDEAEPMLLDALDKKQKAGIAEGHPTLYLALIGLLELYTKKGNKTSAAQYKQRLLTSYGNIVSQNQEAQGVMKAADQLLSS